MTLQELHSDFNTRFGLNPWPKSWEVDKETYENVMIGIIDWKIREQDYIIERFKDSVEYKIVMLTFGPNNGIYFKHVELLVK